MPSTFSPETKRRLADDGFVVVDNVFSLEAVAALIDFIERAVPANANFRKDKDLFAIRNLLGELPGIGSLLWTAPFNKFIDELLGVDYFMVKAIYFDKPALSNWLVTWHQDTTISVDRKADIPGYGPWSLKQGLAAVRPDLECLEDIYTIRIHLDDCDAGNGALKVIPGSHRLGILKDNDVLAVSKTETICAVESGGVMIMRPLLLHASAKSTSERRRRVIHLEFASKELPGGLRWREKVRRSRC